MFGVHFRIRLIGRLGPTEWPLQSSSGTPCDLFLWGGLRWSLNLSHYRWTGPLWILRYRTVTGLSALRTGRPYTPRDARGTHFCCGWVDGRTMVRPEGLRRWKITPSGIESATFRLVTQCLQPTAPPLTPIWSLRVNIKNTWWTGTTNSGYFFRCSSWVLRASAEPASFGLQKCDGLYWTVVLSDSMWALSWARPVSIESSVACRSYSHLLLYNHL